MIDRKEEVKRVLKENGWEQSDKMFADDYILTGDVEGKMLDVCTTDIASSMQTAVSYNNNMDYISKHMKPVALLLALGLVGCGTVQESEFSEPLYGPHDIQLRNAYSDGWQDAMNTWEGWK